MTFKEAEKVYKKHGLSFYKDSNGYPYTMKTKRLSDGHIMTESNLIEDLESHFSESELNKISEAFDVLASQS